MKTDQPPTPTSASGGRALDVLCAEQIMGWRRETLYDQERNPDFLVVKGASMYRPVGQREYLVPPDWNGEEVGARGEHDGLVIGGDIPPYSTDIAAAWAIVEHLRARGFGVIVATEDAGWEVEITVNEALYAQGYRGVYTHGPAPLAICQAVLFAFTDPRRAALSAVGDRDDE